MSTDDGAQAPTPVPQRVRIVLDGRVLAASDAALRVDHPHGPPTLWLPRGDVDVEVLERAGTGAWRDGEGALAHHVAVDAHSLEEGPLRAELVDGAEGDDERDVTVKRFPTWGDATDLVALVDLHAVDGDDGVARATVAGRPDWRRPVVEGSQILGGAIVAAMRHAGQRRAVSSSMVFTRAVDAQRDFTIELEEVSAGRTFTTMTVCARQDDRTGATGTILLDVTAPDVIRHAEAMPDVAGPYESEPYDMSVTGRDLRIVDGAYTGDPDAPTGPPALDAWVRFADLPDDRALHAGLLAQFTGHLSIAAAMRPHAGVGQDQAHVSLSTAVNAISLSIHADVHADRWLLYHHRSTFAGDGMTHGQCRVHSEDGALVASFSVDSMVRAFADPERSGDAADPRTAL